MTTEPKKIPAPKLRFKQFEGVGEWEEVLLGSIASSVTDRATSEDKNDVLTLSGEFGLIKQGDYFGKKIAGESTERYIRILRDDFVYNDRITKSSEYGTIKRLSRYDFGIVSPIYKCFRFLSGEDKGFWQYYFESGSHDQRLKSFANEGAREGRFNISIGKLLTTHVKRPPTEEQTHIAACLSSLDAVISAHQSKLEALRQHKRGLMQQLFPQEGETVPRLRFPEFEGAGAWEEKRLGELGTLVGGLTYRPDDIREEGLLVLRSSNIQNGRISLEDCVYVRPDIKGANISRKGDILICVRNGSASLIGKNAIIGDETPLSTHGAFMTVFRADNPDFCQNLFRLDRYFQLVANDLGATINSINGGNLINYKFYIPTLPEQKRIAACLSSLDELIGAQQGKIAALQEFKRGLMQGLFPSTNAAQEAAE